MVRGTKTIIFSASKIGRQSFNVYSAATEHTLLYSYLYKHICEFTNGIEVINCTRNGELICSVKIPYPLSGEMEVTSARQSPFNDAGLTMAPCL